MSQAIRILLVEDNKADADLFYEVASGIHADIDWVTTLDQALRRVQQADIVVLDLELPDSKGKETLDRYFASVNGTRTPVLIATALNSPEEIMEAGYRGAQFVLKSVLENVMRQQLEASIYCAIGHARREKERIQRKRTLCQELLKEADELRAMVG